MMPTKNSTMSRHATESAMAASEVLPTRRQPFETNGLKLRRGLMAAIDLSPALTTTVVDSPRGESK